MNRTIFDVLLKDHALQRSLVDKLIRIPRWDVECREAVYERLSTEITTHVCAEEQCLYEPLMDSGFEQDQANRRFREHKEIIKTLSELGSLQTNGPEWPLKARELHFLIHQHLFEEEHNVFKHADRQLAESQQSSLALRYQEESEAKRKACA